MNRLLEIHPEEKGIVVSKTKLIVVNGGACDFYTISLGERIETPVVISIRATFGEVAVTPDTLQIKPEDYDQPRRIVVVGGKNRDVADSTGEDSSKTELLHYVTSRTPAYDGFAFRLTVILVPTSGAILRSFGTNLHFQLAHENTNKKSQTNPQKVGCGEAHTLILTSQGNMYAFGAAQNGRLGIPRPADLLDSPRGKQGAAALLSFRCKGGLLANYSVPQLITGVPKVRVISVGAAFSACIDERDCLYTWGSNAAGQLGHGHTEDVWQPKKVEFVRTPLLQASCGKNHLLLLTYDGHVYATGEGGEGRLGLGDTHSRRAFERIKALPPARYICAGGSHSAALDSALRVWMWGSNCCGQLGLADWQPSAAFTAASVVADAARVHGKAAGAGADTTPALAKGRAPGASAAAQRSSAGGESRNSFYPEEANRSEGAAKRLAHAHAGAAPGAAGRRSDAAKAGHCESWRRRGESRESILTAYSLSEGYESVSVKPQIVEFLRGKQVVGIALGSLYSIAVTLRGFVYAWGSHELGQLGLPDRLDNQPLPVLVPAFLFSPAVQVFASPCSNCSFVASASDVLNPFLSVSVSNSPLGGGPCTPVSAASQRRSPSPFPLRSSSAESRAFHASSSFRSLSAKSDAREEGHGGGSGLGEPPETAFFSSSRSYTASLASASPCSASMRRGVRTPGESPPSALASSLSPGNAASASSFSSFSPPPPGASRRGGKRKGDEAEARPGALERQRRPSPRSPRGGSLRRKPASRSLSPSARAEASRSASPPPGRRGRQAEGDGGVPVGKSRGAMARRGNGDRRAASGGRTPPPFPPSPRLGRGRGSAGRQTTSESAEESATEKGERQSEGVAAAGGARSIPCARYSRLPSARRPRERGGRGRGGREAPEENASAGEEADFLSADSESGAGDAEVGKSGREGARRKRAPKIKKRTRREEEAAAASLRIAENRRVGHASCTGGSLAPKNAQLTLSDQFGSWYGRLVEREDEERRAADLRYRLRRGEERMKMFRKQAAARREQSLPGPSSFVSPAGSPAAAAHPSSACSLASSFSSAFPPKDEAQIMKPPGNDSEELETPASAPMMLSLPRSPRRSVERGPEGAPPSRLAKQNRRDSLAEIGSMCRGAKASVQRGDRPEQTQRFCTLFSAACRKRPVTGFQLLEPVWTSGEDPAGGENAQDVCVDLASIDFLAPAYWPVRGEAQLEAEAHALASDATQNQEC
ncbi:hypothetical protein BESB_048960 [Besnoitia besnoiti]|uniref:Regulator of chromosome condensation (RCC1) repeat-containing protein n=1 Tax=Besnoitia besnoiti TaxID=94643 RepID=A0A2A9MHP5_BESBE|nr:hypothetical protein BESB_048960 [Besnoitia besnoiti]PFH36704.1 hypothetical protein BESB_048960 [Besnoitia besnoiti]